MGGVYAAGPVDSDLCTNELAHLYDWSEKRKTPALNRDFVLLRLRVSAAEAEQHQMLAFVAG